MVALKRAFLKLTQYKRCYGFLLFSSFLLLGSGSLHAATSNSIDSLKVAYLYNIAKFTHWPEGTWSMEQDPFQLCFYGDNIVSNQLILLQGKTVNGHPINVLKPTEEDEFLQCNAFYIDVDTRHRYRFLLSLIDQQRVLVVTDESVFLNSGGLINLVEIEQRLRFEVSVQQLNASQLKLSSKILKLAILVNDS